MDEYKNLIISFSHITNDKDAPQEDITPNAKLVFP